MTTVEADALLAELGQRFEIAPGLDDGEFARAERIFDVRFPPDLRLLLSRGLPRGDRFPDWRGAEEYIWDRLRWPEEGILFDVENGVWTSALGPRPEQPTQARAQAIAAVRAAPRLVPIYSHRYLAAEPFRAGNPVFSVYQSDVIRYGDDLASYLRQEFGVGFDPAPTSAPTSRIRFWDDLVDGDLTTGADRCPSG